MAKYIAGKHGRWIRTDIFTVAAILIILILQLAIGHQAHAGELSGFVATEARVFLNPPLFEDQKHNNASIILQPEYYHKFATTETDFIFVPFIRLDSADTERNHFDLRELYFLKSFETWEVGVGIRKVFWGVTESQHMVDIINQTDLVESPDEEEKFGQPMINISFPRRWGTLDMFVMPYFRERSFPGRKGRLRTERVVDTDKAIYESGAKEHRIDLAARYRYSFRGLDIGLSEFWGTGREPTLIGGTDDAGRPVLIPFYEMINQAGLDVQWTHDRWLWKFEGIHRSGQGDPFFALTGGFEYTLSAVAGTKMDLGIIFEWLYNEKGADSTSPFENDAMAGVRLAVNDMSNTELLLGIIQDLDTKARLLYFESSRRLSKHWKIMSEGRVFSGQSPSDKLYDLREDDFIQASLVYYL